MGACRLYALFLSTGADNTADSECSNQVVKKVAQGIILHHVCSKTLNSAADVNISTGSLDHMMGSTLENKLATVRRQKGIGLSGRCRNIH